MPFVRDAWYIAAWSEQVQSGALLARTILGEHLVLFRDASGTAHALADLCPHQLAPLSMGQLRDGNVECGYHGLRFAGDGRCVLNPHGDGRIPPTARVRTYPLRETNGILWLWCGRPALAETVPVPDYDYLSAPATRTLRGHKVMQANYLLIADNLMDPSHSQWVHGALLATSAFDKCVHTVREADGSVHSNYWIPDGPLPRSFIPYFDTPPESVDFWMEFEWRAVSVLRNRTGTTPTGRPREEGREKRGTHMLTPETETSTHYFFAHTRSFGLDDPAVDQQILDWQHVGFGEQDGPMIEAVQRARQTDAGSEARPVILSIDAASVRVRRIIAAMIEDEVAGAPDSQRRRHAGGG